MITSAPQVKPMQLETEKIGQIQYTEKDLYHLPNGLFGFENEKDFVLYESKNVHPFIWFQSTQSPALAFLLINPQFIRTDYQLKAKREDLKELNIENEEECQVYTIVSVHGGDPNNITVNFQGPLVFNLKKRLVQQVICENESLQAPLLHKAVS